MLEYSCFGILYNDIKEQTINTHNSVDEFHRHNIEQKPLHKREYILHDSIK